MGKCVLTQKQRGKDNSDNEDITLTLKNAARVR